jgi:hypothetical protein
MDPEIGCRRILDIHIETRYLHTTYLVRNYSTGFIIVMFDYYVSWAIFCSFAWPSICPNSWVLTDESRYMGLWLPRRALNTYLQRGVSWSTLQSDDSSGMLISGILNTNRDSAVSLRLGNAAPCHKYIAPSSRLACLPPFKQMNACTQSPYLFPLGPRKHTFEWNKFRIPLMKFWHACSEAISAWSSLLDVDNELYR